MSDFDWITGFEKFMQDAESPDRFIRWSAIAAVSAVAQRKIWLEFGDLTFYPNFYIILIGPPATRKGTAIRPARNFVDFVGIPMCANSITREKFIIRLENSANCFEKGNALVTHCSLAIWAEELSTLIGKYNEQLVKDLTELYDCGETFKYETKNMGDNAIGGVFVTWLGATTPESFRTVIPQDAIGTGLSSRMLFVCATRKRKKSLFPNFTRTAEGIQLDQELKSFLTELYGVAGNFTMSSKFFKAYTSCYGQMPDDCPFDPQHFAHYWDRRAQHLLKLSMVLALSRGAGIRGNPLVLKENDFERALSYLEDIEQDMPYAYSSAGRAKEAYILNKVMIRVKIGGEVYYSDLLSELIRDTNERELTAVIMSLEKIGVLKTFETGKGLLLRWVK